MLYTDYFIHPNDKNALETLKSIPGFTQLSRKFSEIFVERGFKISNLSSKIRINKRQLPDIYELLPPICDKLEIPVPEFYLEQNPYINAYTSGDTTPFIVITSGLLDACSFDVIKTVLAHECGHIVCHHVVYKTMASFFLNVGASLFNFPFLSFALKYALLYWDRCSEYSADRAAAYVGGGANSVVETMTALACGSSSLIEKIDRDEFLKQSDDFHAFSDSSTWNKFLMYYELIQTDHPFVSERAADIVKWCDSKDFSDLCSGVPYSPKNPAAARCPKCGAPLDDDTSFCHSCGSKIVHCPGCSAVFTEEDKFCDKCGSNLS